MASINNANLLTEAYCLANKLAKLTDQRVKVSFDCCPVTKQVYWTLSSPLVDSHGAMNFTHVEKLVYTLQNLIKQQEDLQCPPS